jgi:hypothetical protein
MVTNHPTDLKVRIHLVEMVASHLTDLKVRA